MTMDYGALLPEIVLLAGAVIVLLGGSFLPQHRQWIVSWLGVAPAVASAATAAFAAGDVRTVFSGSYAIDSATTTVRILAPLAAAVVVVLSRSETRGAPRESETVALMLLATLGTVVLGGAHDLLLFATGFLLASVPLYALIGLSRTRRAAEAAMKTYLLAAILGVVMLGGIAILGGIAGSTSLDGLPDGLVAAPRTAVAIGFAAVLAGLLFKAGAVPGHFWMPDAVEAAGIGAAAFLSTVPKLGALVAIARLVSVLPESAPGGLLVALVAATSMVLGTLAAFWQHDARRLVGWSTVAQAGFLLLPVAVIAPYPDALGPLLVYLVFYVVTNLAIFAVIAALPHRRGLQSWRGAGRRHPLLVAVLVIGLLSLVGTPPTVVFAAKASVFAAAWAGGAAWLVVVAAAASVASLFYSLRWIAPAVRSDPSTPPDRSAVHSSRGSVAIAIALGIAVLVAAATALPLLAATPHLIG